MLKVFLSLVAFHFFVVSVVVVVVVVADVVVGIMTNCFVAVVVVALQAPYSGTDTHTRIDLNPFTMLDLHTQKHTHTHIHTYMYLCMRNVTIYTTTQNNYVAN